MNKSSSSTRRSPISIRRSRTTLEALMPTGGEGASGPKDLTTTALADFDQVIRLAADQV